MSNQLTGYICKRDTENFQFVYASQNYNTFYCVFLKFHVKGKKVPKIELKLINYKGLVNLGFNEAKIEKDTELDDNGNLELRFNVRGLTGIDTQTVIFGKPIHLDDLKRIQFFRTLLYLSPENPPKPTYKGVFDEEYFYRSGIDTVVRTERFEGQLGYSGGITPKGGPSGKCHTSFVNTIN